MTVMLASRVALGVDSFSQYQREMSAVTVGTMSAEGVPDGEYDWSCSVGYIQARGT